MKKGLIIALIAVGVVVIIGGWFLGVYNGLVSKNEAVNNQWAKVETQYQRRFDLIPNLVTAVKAVMTQEQKIFGDLADARTRYAGATSVDQKVAAANAVESSLGRLLVIMENYPQLKSFENVSGFMVQLEGTENRIAVERSRYNDGVASFNVYIKTFPNNVLVGMYVFAVKTYFQADVAAATAHKVYF